MASNKPSNKLKSSCALTGHTGAELSKSSQFPIVGVGASAGGLEAFTQLFKNLPAKPGIAFVLIQHLAPAHESMLTELLSKTTAMPVREVKDGMTVDPDNVYVIPPDTEMVIFQGALHLMPRGKTKGQYMPVDSFLRSLAQDRGNNAIAVILSGSGSDGSMGIRAVKGEGGIVFAQDETAKYDGMPKSAIDTGCVDFVLPADKIAAELLRIRRHPYLAPVRRGEPVQIMPAEENDLNKIFILLRSARGVDFTSYKRSTIMRRVNRRMLLQKIEGMETYVAYLKENPSEIETLYQDILINVTSFFREPEAFETLKRSVFPYIVNKASADAPVRIWVPACSTGEEAYSIVMALVEYMDDNKISRPVQLFATDIDDIAVEKARKGIYPENISRDVSPERLRRFFEKTGGGYVINKFVREMCIFAKQNMVKDPPFSKIDLISCRNVLIYFGPELQKKTVRILFYALNPKGFLMIGPSETVGEFAGLFSIVDKKHTIYAKKGETSRQYFEASEMEYGKEKGADKKAELQPAGVFDVQRAADTILLTKYSPAGFVVSEALKILQFRGDTGPYLRPAPGQASLDLMKMVSEDLVTELRTAFHQAKRENIQVRKERSRFKHDNRIKYINIDVVPFKASVSGERCFLVLFEEPGKSPIVRAGLKPAPAAKGRPEDEETIRLRQELVESKAHLNTVTQEYEAANEELRALNEELQSSNEEMQSINEEMETAREELQSTNEELTTVNDELQSRNEETTQLNNDLFNVLRGVEIPIVLLGGELQIRRFNDAAARLLNLIPSDAGRPLSNIRTKISIPDLEQMVHDVINTLVMTQREVQDDSDRWYSLTIRPYKTVDNRIDGVLMTLVDIDDIKRNLVRVKEAYEYANAIVETVREPLLVLDPDLRVITANRSFYENFQADPEETEGRYIYELGNGQWNIPDLMKQLQEVLPEKKSFSDFEVVHEFQNLGRRTMLLNAREISREEPNSNVDANLEGLGLYKRLILLAFEDITDRKSAESALQESEERYRLVADYTYDCEYWLGVDRRYIYMSPSCERVTGYCADDFMSNPELFQQLAHPDDRETLERHINEGFDDNKICNFDFRIIDRSGGEHWINHVCQPVYGSDGQRLGRRASNRDITDRKKAEEALLASSERYRSYIEVTGALGWTTNPDGEVVEDLPSWRIYTGQTYEEIKGQGWSKALHPDDLEHALHIWEKAVTGKSDYEVEYRIRRRDGIYRDFMVRGIPVLKEDGSIREWVGTCIDITERKKSEEALKILNRELQFTASELKAAYKDMESFSHSASHDLREPLMIIDGFSRILLKKYGKQFDDNGKEMLSLITETAEKMNQLINDLLSFARVSAKGVVKSDIDVPWLAQGVFEEMKSTIVGRQVKLDMKDLPVAWGDPPMIRQVLVNLLSNALKFTRPRENVKIEIGGSVREGETVYYVTDNGIGFSSEQGEELFGHFKRLHPMEKFEGTGLGLAIVKRIIEKHGGRVWAEGKPDEGAKFYFTLPGKAG